ncbi:MAG: HAMP domain-containing histidine kinase [Bacilli bacterium]|nr:HAMP domain-containing histidine kinase [Bacilli bacterium]
MENINRCYDLDIYKVLHEIKNPLTVVSGYLELMNGGGEYEKYYQIIEEEVNRTLSIIKNYSMKKDLIFEEVEISYFMEEIQSILRDLYGCDDVSIELEGNEDIYLYTNYDILKQIVMNILKNSYEAKGDSSLCIKISWKMDDVHTIIEIQDNGIGMDSNELKKISREYYTTKENGTGLGVPFIYEMIKKLDGLVEYESCKNVGTLVRLSFFHKKNSEEF